MKDQALGLIEVIGLVPAVEGADSALKAANVTLVGLSKVGADIVTVALIGDVGAIQSAVEAGAEAAARVGHLRTTDVIARLDHQVRTLFLSGLGSEEVASPVETVAPLKETNVHQRVSDLLATIPVADPKLSIIPHFVVADTPNLVAEVGVTDNLPLSPQLTMSAETNVSPSVAKKPRRRTPPKE